MSSFEVDSRELREHVHFVLAVLLLQDTVDLVTYRSHTGLDFLVTLI